MKDRVSIDLKDGVADVRLIRADKMNALDAAMFDALIATMLDTRLEPDLEELCWSTVNIFHRAGERIERDLATSATTLEFRPDDADGWQPTARAGVRRDLGESFLRAAAYDTWSSTRPQLNFAPAITFNT